MGLHTLFIWGVIALCEGPLTTDTCESEEASPIPEVECVFDHLSWDASWGEFQPYFENQQPVILTGGSRRDQIKNFQEICSIETLTKRYHNVTITASAGDQYSSGSKAMTFGYFSEKYLHQRHSQSKANKIYYLFGGNQEVWEDLFPHYPTTEIHTLAAEERLRNSDRQIPSDPRDMFAFSFGIGGDRSGVPLHEHFHVLNEVIHGKKHMLLYPPGSETGLEWDMTSANWYRDVYPTLTNKPMECILEPGDAVYIPDYWMHATINYGITVFMAVFL